METNSSTRISYWDNLKALLIFLVVLGHFLLPVHSESGKLVDSVYIWIYLFHMPAFVFVSGFFAKRYVQKGARDTGKLLGFLVLYVLFSVALWVIKLLFTKQFSRISLFTTSGAQWYLLCMFFWYLAIPVCARVRPLPMLLFSLLIGLVIGLDPNTGDFLSISRCFVFFPFFLAGYYLDGGWHERIRPWMTVVSILFLVFVFFAVYFFHDFFKQHTSVLYANNTYKSLSGLAERFIWYLAAGVLLLALLCAVPRRKLFFSVVGQRTLAIYIFHRLIREICQRANVYDVFASKLQMFGFCIGISILITVVFSEKHITALLNKAFSAKYKSILKDEASET